MAVFLNNGVVVTVNAIDLSNHVTSATLNWKYDSLEVTSMGATAHEYIAGLQSGSVDLEFNNDRDNGSVLQTLNGLVGTTTTVTLKQTNAATSATNPLYTFTVFVDAITPINGAVSALGTQSCSWQLSGPVVKTTS